MNGDSTATGQIAPFTYDNDYYEQAIGGFHRASFPVISKKFEELQLQFPLESILDFGCGNGFWARFLRAHCSSLYGEDFSEALESNPNRSLYAGFERKDLGVEQPDSGNTHDLLFSVEVIEHVQDYRQFLRNAYRRLKPGGTMFLTTTTYFCMLFVLLIVYRRQVSLKSLWEFTRGLAGNEHYRTQFVLRFWDYCTGHYHGFTKRQLHLAFTEAGFEIERIEYLDIQPVVPVYYLDQTYRGPHKWLVAGAVPFVRAGGKCINYFCRKTMLYTPNVVVVARKPR